MTSAVADAAHDQRAGKDIRQVVAARPRGSSGVLPARDLAHRNRFARQQRFIGLQVVTLEQNRVGGHAVALGEHHNIAAHHLASRNALGARHRG